jgi:phytoene dehydrogenase-like protein
MNTAQVQDRVKTLTTADVAAAADKPEVRRDVDPDARLPEADRRTSGERRQQMSEGGEQLAPLFAADVAGDFRSRWDAVQIGFVDDPRQAVRQADELVAQVMKSLAESFSAERARFEGQLEEKDSASTENLRVALRRYRSFFERLLSL